MIDHGQDPKRPAVEQLIMHEIHAPALALGGRDWSGPPVQCPVLSATAPMAELQALQAIQPPHALPIHEPAFAAEQDMEAQIAKARPRVRELTQAHPERRLVFGGARPVPRRPGEASRFCLTPASAANGHGSADTASFRKPLVSSEHRSAAGATCAGKAPDATLW